MQDWYAKEGSPSPLGVTWVEDEAAYNFALYSKYATAVTLLLYSEMDLLGGHPKPATKGHFKTGHA